MSPRFRAIALLAAGTLLSLAYLGWFFGRTLDASEFGYAPFTPEPLPYSPMRGFTYEQLWGHVARVALLLPGLLLATLGLSRLRPLAFRTTSRRVLQASAALSLGVTASVMLGVLRGRAISDDELVYRMQATFYAAGKLTGPELGFTPPDYFSVATRLGYTGKYLPGEGLVQVLGALAGVPALMHLPLLALTLFVWHRQVALRHGERSADFATSALALSPMVMLTAASGVSETTSLCAVALAGLGLEWARSSRPYAGALLTAWAVSFGMAARPQSLLPVGLVLVPWLAWSLVRQRKLAALGLFALLLGAGAVALGAYNHALSGSPLRLPWYLQCTIEHYGFGRVWQYDTFEHTPWTALENLGVVLVRLNAWWLGLPCSLGVLVLAAWLRTPLGRFREWWVAAAAIVLFEALYYSPGASDTGSLYHHELVLPGSLLAAAVVEAALARAPALATTGLALHLALGTGLFLADETARLSRLVTAIHADSDAALAKLKAPAVLFHESKPSELLVAGWLFDSFPRRYRGLRDPVVTFPNLPERGRNAVLGAYPGRACYYYRRHPGSAAAELYRCEDARALMDRPYGLDDERPLWTPPTAYEKSDYDPFRSNGARRVRDGDGRPLVSCCSLKSMARLGAAVPPRALARCVPDGPEPL